MVLNNIQKVTSNFSAFVTEINQSLSMIGWSGYSPRFTERKGVLTFP